MGPGTHQKGPPSEEARPDTGSLRKKPKPANARKQGGKPSSEGEQWPQTGREPRFLSQHHEKIRRKGTAKHGVLRRRARTECREKGQNDRRTKDKKCQDDRARAVKKR